MLVNLTKYDLARMICGSDCSYEKMQDPRIAKLGYYSAGFIDRWNWYYDRLITLNESELWSIYQSLFD